jgi:hypothetical protein
MRIDQDPALSSFGIPQPGAGPGPVTRRQRMIDEASAVVAIDGSTPFQPRPDSLATIHRRLDAVCGSGPKGLRVAAWSGWACAFAAAALAWQLARTRPVVDARPAHHPPPAVPEAEFPDRTGQPGADDLPTKQLRMSQEIDALRQQLKHLGERDAARMTTTPGVSWPVIMKMTRPGTHSEISPVDLMLASLMDHAEDEESDAGPVTDLLDSASPVTHDAREPAAIPVYDPARDKGQLILINLPEPNASEAYHLWMKNDESAGPILVGTLPKEVDPVSTTMDFKLGTTGVVPDNFWITRDARQSPQFPSNGNIVLQGPEMR